MFLDRDAQSRCFWRPLRPSEQAVQLTHQSRKRPCTSAGVGAPATRAADHAAKLKPVFRAEHQASERPIGAPVDLATSGYHVPGAPTAQVRQATAGPRVERPSSRRNPATTSSGKSAAAASAASVPGGLGP